jgi:hypothetical protein
MEWEALEIAVTIDIIFVLTKALTEGFFDKLSNFAVEGRLLKVLQN